MLNPPFLKPRLLAKVTVDDSGQVLLQQKGREFHVEAPGLEVETLSRWLQNLESEWDSIGNSDDESMKDVVEQLALNGLVCSAVMPEGRSGMEALLELEDVANELLYKTLYKNVFWRNVQSTVDAIPVNVLYGLAIENYHFLFRESWFDSPALSFLGSTRARLLMNEFYAEEYGHDELILRGLNSIGISREDLADTLPLAETLALCNGLAYWARYDPIFFFTTLGILEGKDLQTDSYLLACERFGLSESFVRPIRTHSDINVKGQHGNLSRMVFSAIPFVDRESLTRMRAQTHLFIEMYDRFYEGVWHYYSTCSNLLRRCSDI
jgi:hypothetical protein